MPGPLIPRLRRAKLYQILLPLTPLLGAPLASAQSVPVLAAANATDLFDMSIEQLGELRVTSATSTWNPAPAT